MIAAQIQIRRLAKADAALYRNIRLDSLRCNPEAFGSTFDAEQAQPLSWFAERLGNSEVFGAFSGAELSGIAGFYIQSGQKMAHKGVLWGMYVRADARKSGIGRKLAEAILEAARRSVELIQLTVVTENEPARRLYASLGFVEYGRETNGLKQDGRYYDEILMAKDLRPNST